MDSRPKWLAALRRLAANTTPAPAALETVDRSQPMFGTVRSLDPLRIALDNDPTTTLPYSPPCVDYPTRVGQRVWVETYGSRVVVIGVSRGAPDLPVGTGAIWTGMSNVAPGLPWMLAEGQALSRVEFSEAFAVWGTTYGAPDSTRFNIPDVRGKMIVGRNTAEAEFDSIGETGGAKTHTLTVSQMPAHGHYAPNGSLMFYVEGTDGNMRRTSPIANAGSAGEPGVWRQRIAETAGTVRLPTASEGGGQPHNNMPPYLVERYMVKVR